MWDRKDTINRLKVFCAEMSNKLFGGTGISLTFEGEAGASQAHPQQVIWGLALQWTPLLSGPWAGPGQLFLCVLDGVERKEEDSGRW